MKWSVRNANFCESLNSFLISFLVERGGADLEVTFVGGLIENGLKISMYGFQRLGH